MTKFLKPDHPSLRKIAQEIPENKISSERTKSLIRKMSKIASGEQKDPKKPIMVGLAAPQIGISKRVILVDKATNGKGKIGNLCIYINPQIVWKSKQEKEWYEGCYSTDRVCGIVSRPTSVKIRAYISSFPLVKWERRIEKHTGYIARIFQHEIDHLDGKVFIDHIKDPDKLHWVLAKEFNKYRKTWKNWPIKCSFEKWQNIQKPLA